MDTERREQMTIKEARRLKGITQEELACRVGTNQKIISRYECGKQVPSLKRAKQIAQALSVRLDKLAINKKGGAK